MLEMVQGKRKTSMFHIVLEPEPACYIKCLPCQSMEVMNRLFVIEKFDNNS